MAFVLKICSEDVFRQLLLPDYLRSDERLNPLGQTLVFDLERRCALIPHPFHHSDYPNRYLNFFEEGRKFNGQELVQEPGMPDRVYLFVDFDADQAACEHTASLMSVAMAVFCGETTCSLPVEVYRTGRPFVASRREP